MIDKYTMIVKWLTTMLWLLDDWLPYYDCEMIDYHTIIVRWLTTILWLWDDWLPYYDCEMIDFHTMIVRWLTIILWLWDDWLLHSDYLAHSRTSLFCPDRVIRMIELSGTTQRCHHHGFSMSLVEYDLYNDTDCQEKFQNKVIIKF